MPVDTLSYFLAQHFVYVSTLSFHQLDAQQFDHVFLSFTQPSIDIGHWRQGVAGYAICSLLTEDGTTAVNSMATGWKESYTRHSSICG